MTQLRPDAAVLIIKKKKKIQEPQQVKEIAPPLVAALVHFTSLCGNLSGYLTRMLLTVKRHPHGDGFACWLAGSRLTPRVTVKPVLGLVGKAHLSSRWASHPVQVRLSARK